MKANDWLKKSTEKVDAASVPTSRLDALILLEDITKKDRSWLLAHPEFEISENQVKLLDQQIERRNKHEPLAYIRGKSEFYGREFFVTPATLQPRPETETMIALCKQLKNVSGVADIGTGSGCIAVTLKLENPELNVIATEINDEALVVAKQNAQKLHAEVMFFQGNLLEPIVDKKFDVILANLPYVPDTHTINEAAMQEPKIAIFGGVDGLDLYQDLFTQISLLSAKPMYVLTESLPYQHEKLAAIAKVSGYTLAETDDFIQQFILEARPRA